MPPYPLVCSADKIIHICEVLFCTAETPGENHQVFFIAKSEWSVMCKATWLMRRINRNNEDLLKETDSSVKKTVCDHAVKDYHKKYMDKRSILRFHTQP